MFFEAAIGIKAIVIIVSLIGLFLGLFPEIDLFKKSPQDGAPVQGAIIDNEWAALTATENVNALNAIERTVAAHQETAQRADDNAAYVAMYTLRSTTVSAQSKRLMLILCSLMIAGTTIAFPVRRKEDPHAA